MICHAGITLLTDEAGTPVQVNIDLVRHGAELAAFLRAHGLVETPAGFADGSPAASCAAAQDGVGSPAVLSAAAVPGFRLTLCDELSDAVAGDGLTPLYRKPHDTQHIAVVYRPEVKAPLARAVDTVIAARSAHRPPTDREAYTATLLTALERILRSRRRSRREPAPEEYTRYGRDMFCFRLRLRESRDVLWTVCYTLHETTILVRHVGIGSVRRE